MVHDADLDHGALLLERVLPGTRLWDEPDRWPLEEVLEWERKRRVANVRRVVTGKRPQHHGAARIQPVAVKVVRTLVA